MRSGPRFFRWHRWLAYAVVLQVLAWVLGGVLFAWLPFQGWVKGNDWVHKPQPSLPAGWLQSLAGSAAAVAQGAVPGVVPERAPVGAVVGSAAGPAAGSSAGATAGSAVGAAAPAPHSVQTVQTARGPAWRLRTAHGDTWLAADGSGALVPPDAAAAERFAQALYHGPGRLVGVSWLTEAPRRLGLVRELGARKNLWLARFDDPLQTRLYIDGASGELLAVRTEAWVLYDFFWRLHVMDYSDGEDFNNPLLRGFSLAALALVLTGSVLVSLALSRKWRRWRVHREAAAAAGP